MKSLFDERTKERLLVRAKQWNPEKSKEERVRTGEWIPYHPYRQVVTGDGIGMGAIWANRSNEDILAHIGRDRIATHVKGVAQNLRTGKSVILSGPTGTGKTSLAVIAYRLFEKSAEIDLVHYFVRWPTFLARICSGDWNEGTELALRIGKASGLVVVDDFASAALSGSENKRKLEYAEAIVFTRYDAGLPTIYTTNRNLDGIAAQLGDRIASRLSENTIEYYIGGEDLRRIKK